MAEIFDKYESDIEGYEAAMKPLARQAGALFAMNGAIKGLDLFDHPATLGKLLSKLVQSYALDAIDLAFHPAQTPVLANDDVAAFLSALKGTSIENYPVVGLGEDLRLSGESLAGGALALGERVVHLCAFRTVGEHMGESGSRTR